MPGGRRWGCIVFHTQKLMLTRGALGMWGSALLRQLERAEQFGARREGGHPWVWREGHEISILRDQALFLT